MTYFDDTTYKVVDGNIVYAKDLNNPLAALKTSFITIASDIQTTAGLSYAVDTGVADAYAVTLDPAPPAYADGLTVWLKPAYTNTGACTIDVNSLGVVPIKRHGLVACSAGDINANYFIQLKYSSGNFLIVSYSANASVSADEAEASAALAINAAATLAIDSIDVIGDAGTTLDLNASTYDTHMFTCDQATLSLTSNDLSIGRTIALIIEGGSGCTITWPSGTIWPYGTEPSWTSGIDRVVLQRISSTVIHASAAGLDYA